MQFLEGLECTHGRLSKTSDKDGAEGNSDDPVRTHFNAGNAHFKKGAYPQAIDCYSLATVLNTRFEDAYFNRGLAHALAGECDDALEDFNTVHVLNSRSSDAYHAHGLILERMQKTAEAMECYVKAIDLDADYMPRGDKLQDLMRDGGKPDSTVPSSGSSESEISRRLEEATRYFEEKVRRLTADETPSTSTESKDEKKPDEPPLMEIVGLRERWARLWEVIILPLKYHDQEIYKVKVVTSSRGVLLYGPPGCGKNLTVAHLTHEGGIHLLRATLAEVLNMYVGESDKHLKEIFDEAIRRAKDGERILIFIDEVDALGFARGGGPDNEASWNRHLMATFLDCFNDIQPYPNIIVVGATNDPFNVDSALKRPGRLGGTTIYIPPPNELARRELFQLYMKDTPREDDIDLPRLAVSTKWYSGDDIRKICRDVHLKIASSFVEGKTKKATMDDYLEATRKTPSSTQQWFLDIQRRLTGGLIDEMLLDSELQQNLRDFALDHGSRDNPSFAVR